MSRTHKPRRQIPPQRVELLAASLPRLWIALLVDALLAAAIGGSVGWVEAALFDDPHKDSGVWWLDYVANWVQAHPTAVWIAAVLAVAIGVTQAVLGAREGRTVGRRLTGLVVVRFSGRPMTWPIIVLRTIGSVISVAMFGAGFFWIILDPYRRTWHDLLSGTVVVRRKTMTTPGH